MKGRVRALSCILTLCLCMAAVFSGCDSSGENRKITSIKIGFAVYDQYDEFIAAMMDRVNEDVTRISSETGITVNIEIANASGSQSTQNTQVKNMINHGCDVICVNPVDRTDTAYIMDLAQENDIPMVFFNREPVREDLLRWEKFYYVGADPVQSGIMQGELAAEYCKKHPEIDVNGDGVIQYMVFEGEAGHQDAIMRTEYAVSTLEEKGISVEKVSNALANWSRDQAKAKMLSILASGISPELILSNNDMMAMGVISAYEEAGTEADKWPAIFGIDGVDIGLEAIEAGKMIATVYNDKEGQADAIVNLAYALATDGSIEQFDFEEGTYIWLPYSMITTDNVSDLRDDEE